MAGKSSNPWYFEYQDYLNVKKKLDYIPTDKFDIKSANDLIRDIHNTLEKELNLHKTFYDLKKFVQRHPCFYHYGTDNCCNYINYWLNKTVRESDYRVNEKNFDIFDKFMRVDPNIQKSSIDCISKLSYMKKDVYEKIKKLYDLYDYFTKLKESEDPSELCHNISSLAQMYESVLHEFSLSRSQGLEKQAHTLEKQVQILGKQIQVLEKQAREESERTLPVPLEQFPRQLPALPSIYPQQFPLKLPSLPSEPLDPSEESEETGPKGPFGKSEPEPELRQEQEQHIDILEDADPFLEDERDIFPEEGYPPAGSTMHTFDTGTIMGTIKDAVSNVLEAVEPVPILGVSGGMGALYLLLKVSKVAL
ncbi:hypothetical protein PVNG_03843 [Plasmodium vivax North Korean]|uniref:VIR protein n=1 Tax=Plasmodium vivax North Korean TaxID=1035514 RepID=A0A0J9TTV9_PLAVI|nr:hypothetical protein PVNG_03843 [Plasmodium vivax North Korean]